MMRLPPFAAPTPPGMMGKSHARAVEGGTNGSVECSELARASSSCQLLGRGLSAGQGRAGQDMLQGTEPLHFQSGDRRLEEGMLLPCRQNATRDG